MNKRPELIIVDNMEKMLNAFTEEMKRHFNILRGIAISEQRKSGKKTVQIVYEYDPKQDDT